MESAQTCTGLWRVSVLTKSAIVLSAGIFGLLVAWTNLTAYDINFRFVQHVLSMDALAPWAKVDALTQRAVTDPELQRLAYAAIILAEFLFGLICTVAGLLLFVAALRSDVPVLMRGKAAALLGLGLGVLIWYFGFAVMGAEYFAMWASQWNGQTTAYLFAGFLLLTMVYVAQAEPGQTDRHQQGLTHGVD